MNSKGHLPIINEWKLNNDNTISGLLRGSDEYLDDAQFTTSPIIGRANTGSIVQTKSGTRYFLGGKASSSSNASGRYPLTAICETLVVAEAIDPGECEIAKDSNVSAADVVVPPQNPDFINELRHDRLCTTIVSSLEDLDIDEPVHRSSSPPNAANTNTSTLEDDMKLPVWKKKRFFLGICLILAFIGVLVAFVSFAAPSSKEADEDSNIMNSGNIRGTTTMNSSDILQSSQVKGKRLGLPPVEDRSETLPTDNSAQNSSIGTNITNVNTDPWGIYEQDQYDIGLGTMMGIESLMMNHN